MSNIGPPDEEWGMVPLGDEPAAISRGGHGHSSPGHSHQKDKKSGDGHGHSHGHGHGHGEKNKSKGKSGHGHSHGEPTSRHSHSHGGSSCDRHHEDIDISGPSDGKKEGWLSSAVKHAGKSVRRTGQSLRAFLRSVSMDDDNRSLLVFIFLRFAWLLLLLVFSNYVESLALRAFSYQAFVDCSQLLIRLVATHFKHQPPSEKWSYGWGRTEVLLRFACGLYGAFFATFISFEGLEHLAEAPHHASSLVSTFVVVFNGLLLNLLSIIFIRKHILGGRAEHRQQLASFVQRNFHGLVMENAPCFVLLLGAWFTELDIQASDPISALLIAAISFYVSVPVCIDMGKILLLTSPRQIKDVLYKTIKEASHVEGVLETCDEHFWANSPGEFVGTLTLRVNLSASESSVLERVTQMFSHIVSHLTIQVEKSKWETS
ncbi:MAG: cation diffusion facilitator family transporter [archaeon]|nr:cation diffusion facilitator family transporter [archaeon]